MWQRWSVGMAVCAIYVPAGRSGFSHLLSHLAHRWSKGETCASVRNMRERYSFVCRVIIAAAVMNPNLCTRLPRVRSTR